MYVVLDFETTGLDYKTEQVIEIGAVKLNQFFEEIGSFHTMVALQPHKELPEKITELTGITKLDLDEGMNEVVALNMLKDFIGNDIVVAQFASFDLGFLSKVFEPELFICTRSLSQILNPKEKASLKDLVERYGVELEGHHRSMNDVRATIEVLKIMLKEVREKGLPFYNLLFSSEERRLRFIPVNAVVADLDGYIAGLEKRQVEKENTEPEEESGAE